jgi:hypothetical protein
MYYAESSTLIANNAGSQSTVGALDREIAHAYSPAGHGYTELPLLLSKVNDTQAAVEALMTSYETSGVVASYERVECQCGESYDGRRPACPNCGRPVASARRTGVTCYEVLKQPSRPSFNPASMPQAPEVFISYRHSDTETLATDIYYSLLKEGLSVFLDDGHIAVGANPEEVFLRAASSAGYFIALVSENYFGSRYCKKEIAHAARAHRRLIRVNVPPNVPAAPPEMPWVNAPNWNPVQGDRSGLTPALEASLLNAVRTPASANVADLRLQACRYLLDQLSLDQVNALWSGLSWMIEIVPGPSKSERIRQILQEATPPDRLAELCTALGPR